MRKISKEEWIKTDGVHYECIKKSERQIMWEEVHEVFYGWENYFLEDNTLKHIYNEIKKIILGKNKS